jgi:hypothetical protein
MNINRLQVLCDVLKSLNSLESSLRSSSAS